MTRSAVLVVVGLFFIPSAFAEPASKTGEKSDIHNAAANSNPPQPIKLVAAETPVSPKIDELRKKVNELNRLQAEVRQLRAETGSQQQILVRLQMLEVSLTKLRKLGTDINFLGSSTFKLQDIESLTKAIETSSSN